MLTVEVSLIAWIAVAIAHAAPGPALVEAATSDWECEQSQEAMQGVVDSVVEKASEEFPRILRGLARSKLSSSAFFCRQVTIDATADQWHSACGGGTAFKRDWSSGWQPYTTDEGNLVQTELIHDGNSVNVAFQADSGTRTTHYSFADGKMTAEVRISTDQLTKPMTWSFVYRKVAKP